MSEKFTVEAWKRDQSTTSMDLSSWCSTHQAKGFFFLKLWTSDSSEYLRLPIIIVRYMFMSFFHRRDALINPQYHFFQFKIDHQTTFSVLYKQYILLITFSKMRKWETNWVFIIYTYYIYHCFYKACWILLVIKIFLLSQRVLVWTFVMYNI